MRPLWHLVHVFWRSPRVDVDFQRIVGPGDDVQCGEAGKVLHTKLLLLRGSLAWKIGVELEPRRKCDDMAVHGYVGSDILITEGWNMNKQNEPGMLVTLDKAS